MYLLSRHVRSKGIKVVLTGEGADEVFLGYNIFKETLLRKDWRNLGFAERARVISSLYPYLKHYKDDKSSKMLHALYENFSEASRITDSTNTETNSSDSKQDDDYIKDDIPF